MSARRTISPRVSYRVYEDRAVLVDHATGALHVLNPEGGDVVARLDRGETRFDDDEEELVEALAALGIVETEGRAFAAAEAGDDAPGDEGEDPQDELSEWAAARAIPLHCQIELTHRCALRCAHCYLGGKGGDARAELTAVELERVFDDLASLGCLFLLLTGGEPFARADLEDIFAAARDRRFAVSLLTSGYRHDPALLARLARRGIDTAQVSLYGPDAAAHDAITRVLGSFDDAIGCMRTLRDLGVAVRAAVTPTAQTAQRIDEIRALLDREGITGTLGLYLAPDRDGNRAPQALTVEEGDLARVLKAFLPSGDPRMRALELSDRPCRAGACVLSVDPYGEVHPCLQLRVGAGSVRERPISEIWRLAEPLSRLRRLRLADLVDCPTCEDRAWCNRCPGSAYAEGRSIVDHCSFDCLQSKVLKLISEERRQHG